jgi:glucose/mannose-6-phosphate isomerase
MLDDLKLIHERDAQDALGVAQKEPEQLRYNFVDSSITWPVKQFKNIVFAGMGGSALAGSVAMSWPGFTVPFEVVRDYHIPTYVSDETLVIVSSYSGNTEETLNAFTEAKSKNAYIVVISSGGKLVEMAHQENIPTLILPAVSQPRYAVFYGLKATLTITDGLGITVGKAEDLSNSQQFITDASKDWLSTVPTAQNLAKQIAQECVGKSVVIYAGPKLFPAAYKWKIGFNENAKQIAWCNQLPEFNHNEFLGWTKQPTNKPYTVIDLRSNLENPRTQKRFLVTAKLLSGLRPDPIVVETVGEKLVEQLIWSITLGDFVSIYTALLNGLNPTPVDMIEKFKQELAQ